MSVSNITGQALVSEALRLLNDYDEDAPDAKSVHWSENEILEYATDGVRQIIFHSPEANTATQTLTLKPGSRQELDDGDYDLYKIEATLDAYGNPVGQPLRTDTQAASIASTWFDKLGCTQTTLGSANTPYVVTSFQFDDNDTAVFYVYPPVPPGVTVRVLAKLGRMPAPITLDSTLPLDDRYHNAILEWVWYRAFAKDQESATHTTQSAVHWAHFFDLIGIRPPSTPRQSSNSTPTP